MSAFIERITGSQLSQSKGGEQLGSLLGVEE
jgi:hypothetical protein